ncbi:MAG: polyprenyl synthetase family protein, partial [Clostridiales bacterium]|nr:polyprenyl synthetase family protein [Clostridiales bacterium]
MNIANEIAVRTDRVNDILEEYLPAEEGFQGTLLSAMNYSVRAGGKRLRPIMMEETYRCLGGTSDVIKPFMAAMEMIHTYSLVHDDLPAMDNDEYRRGRKTTHAVYGEAMGILAGDALLTYAFETAAKAYFIEPYNPGIGRAIGILANKAGIYGMAGGQAVDVESEKKGQAVNSEKLDFIYKLKTGALMEASMMIGAVLAGASDAQISVTEDIAAKVGMAFQIQDDILDVTGNFEELGKPVGSDERNGKVTYVTYAGIDESAKEVERLSNEAAGSLALLGSDEDTEFL